MIATNLLDNKDFEVQKYKNCYFQVLPLLENGKPFLNLTHRILISTNDKLSDIEEGYRFCHFRIEGKIYKSLLTSNIGNSSAPQRIMDELSMERIIQLSIFDEEDEEDGEDD